MILCVAATTFRTGNVRSWSSSKSSSSDRKPAQDLYLVITETRDSGYFHLRAHVASDNYDNGQRYDGAKTQTIVYPAGDLTKGPNTFWDAPGMHRIKVPFGGLTPAVERLEHVREIFRLDPAAVIADADLHFLFALRTGAGGGGVIDQG